MVDRAPHVDDVIRQALLDAAPAYAARGIAVAPQLASTTALETHGAVLEATLASIFRGLPLRLARGSVLRIWTHDRAGGDVELVWEGDEVDDLEDAGAPQGDLFALALSGLEELCRARHGRVDVDAPLDGGGTRRRRTFLIPPLARRQGWRPASRA